MRGIGAATKIEVDEMWGIAGFAIPQFGCCIDLWDYVAYEDANRFINLFGQTGLVGFPNGQRAAAGVLYGDFGAGMEFRAYEVQAGPLESDQLIGRVRFETVGANSTGGFGLFLVRTVPEPGSFALLGLGLTGLALSRRRET